MERRRRPVGSVRRKAFGLQAKALLGAADHRLRRADLRLTNSARGLNVNDHSELHINEVVVGVGEKSRSAHRPRPLRGRIRRRDELRRDVARRAKGGIIEGCQTFLHRPACIFAGALLVPLRSGDRTLLIGIRRN